MNRYKAFIALKYGERIPRKIKKTIIGKRMSNGKLKRLLKSVKIIQPAKTMYDVPEILPYSFCPKCGCKEYFGTGNKTAYPEHWESFHCLRCKSLVAYIDNSPFIHALECKDNDYDPSF